MGCDQSKERDPQTNRLLESSHNLSSSLHEYQFAPENLEIDPANPPAVIPMKGFHVELGIPGLHLSQIKVEIEHKHRFTLFYRDHFFKLVGEKYEPLGQLNFLGGTNNEPVVVSVQYEPKNKEKKKYQVIVRNKKRDIHFAVHASKNRKHLIARIIEHVPSLAGAELQEVKNMDICNRLKHIEDRLLIKNYKVGVVYCKEGETQEDDMFSNEKGSLDFENFLNLMGDRVRLKGWTGYDGELDIKSDTTGTHSVHTVVDGFGIMFHVSTLLPYSQVNNQQIERKRHIGNDICCIVFMDGDSTPFLPNTIHSKFNHVYAVVQVVKKKEKAEKTYYRVAFASKHGVLPFGPLIPKEGIFEHGQEFRDFLLAKIINAERASYHAPSFAVTRTRLNILRDIIQEYGPKV